MPIRLPTCKARTILIQWIGRISRSGLELVTLLGLVETHLALRLSTSCIYQPVSRLYLHPVLYFMGIRQYLYLAIELLEVFCIVPMDRLTSN
jgi:hypothetical protein